MRTPPSAPSPPPCAAAKPKAADGEVFSGDMICEWGQFFRLVFAHPLSTQGRLRLRCSRGSPCLPRGAVCRSRLRGCPFGARYGLSPHRNVFSKHPGVPHGLFYDQAILWLDLQNAHASGSPRSPSGGRGELRSPLHPPLPPPLFIGRFAAFDRQISKEDVFIPPNAAFAQLSLAHSAAFCYSFLNNRTRCGKRRLLP